MRSLCLGFLGGLIAALLLGLAQAGPATQASPEASHLPSLDVERIRWIDEDGRVHNRIWAGGANFVDEVSITAYGGWANCRTELNSAPMFAICSDVTGDPYGGASVATFEGHRYGDQGWNASPLLYGMQPKGNPGDPAALRVALYYDRVCFAPEGSTQHSNNLDACVQRVGGPYSPDLLFVAGDDYVYLSELAALLGR